METVEKIIERYSSIMALKKDDMPLIMKMFIENLANSINYEVDAYCREQDFYETALNEKHLELNTWYCFKTREIGVMFTDKGFYMSCFNKKFPESELKKALKSLGIQKNSIFIRCLNRNFRKTLFSNNCTNKEVE